MEVCKKLENERKYNIQKIVIPMVFMALIGYFIYALTAGGFFRGWEIYFVWACYISIGIGILALDIRIIWWMRYSIHIDDNKLKIKDGFFSRPIIIPVERVVYISSIKRGKNYNCDTIIITDKKINHSMISRLNEEDFHDEKQHIRVIRELKGRFPEKNFYYYRVYHHGYKFLYYFYVLYKVCERCKFSDTSMELVKAYINIK